MFKNKLYLRDNLDIMRDEIPNGSVDVICTDPPFNSGVQYCTFYHESQTKRQVFDDIWIYNETTVELRHDIEERAEDCAIYRAAYNALKGIDLQVQRAAKEPPIIGFGGAMRSYTTYMVPRLVEGYHCLTNTGSILLHCDPHASYYLRMLLDAIFGPNNFRNEIIWMYNKFGSKRNHFPRNHDVILFYGKSKNITFNPIFKKERTPIMEKYLRIGYKKQIFGNVYQLNVFDRNNPKVKEIIASGEFTEDNINYLDEGYADKKPKFADVWTDIPSLNTNANERFGYPTQKPRILYERLVKFSSNPGDVILDPFLGTGTTIDAAQALNRHWIGIDVEAQALFPTEQRLEDRYSLKAQIDYDVDKPRTKEELLSLDKKDPVSMQEVRTLASNTEGRHKVAEFLTSSIRLYPTPRSGDGGWDGENDFKIWNNNMKELDLKVIAEVKTGQNLYPGQVRDFCYVIDKKQKEMNLGQTAGIFITLEPVTEGMKKEAKSLGTFEHNGKQYPKLQFLVVTDEFLQHLEPHTLLNLPSTRKPRKRQARYVPDNQMEMNIETN